MEDDEIKRVRERLDQLFESVGSVQRATAAIQASCAPCRLTVDKLDDIVRGNGTDGLRSDVASIRQGQEEFKEAHMSSVRFQRTQFAAILAALLGIVGIVVNHFVG